MKLESFWYQMPCVLVSKTVAACESKHAFCWNQQCRSSDRLSRRLGVENHTRKPNLVQIYPSSIQNYLESSNDLWEIGTADCLHRTVSDAGGRLLVGNDVESCARLPIVAWGKPWPQRKLKANSRKLLGWLCLLYLQHGEAIGRLVQTPDMESLCHSDCWHFAMILYSRSSGNQIIQGSLRELHIDNVFLRKNAVRNCLTPWRTTPVT